MQRAIFFFFPRYVRRELDLKDFGTTGSSFTHHTMLLTFSKRKFSIIISDVSEFRKQFKPRDVEI